MKHIRPIAAAGIIFALFMIASCTRSGTPAGAYNCIGLSYVTANTTISAGVYTVNCNIKVSNNAVLTIAPGTTLLFAQDAGLTIEPGAAINAAGTSGQPIIINGIQSVPGYWQGILIKSVSLNNIFTYCTISNGGSSPYPGCQFAANVTLSDASASFSNCTISASKDAGIYTTKVSPDSTYFNSFSNNILLQNGSYPIITYSYGASSLGAGNNYTANTNNYIGILSSEVAVPVSLSAQTVPYALLQTGTDAGVIFDKALTIAAGTSIAMGNGISLLVSPSGTISAIGTANNQISFTGQHDTAGYWGSVIVNSNSTLNSFQYCSFAYGGGSPAYPIASSESNKGLLSTYMPVPAVRSINVANCTFSYSASSGVYVAAADGTPLPTYNPNLSTANVFSSCSPDVQY